ncbi:MAG: hypothetical protein WC859_10115 [Elusimicrobiota bacterium]|jgi:hypothetical protein
MENTAAGVKAGFKYNVEHLRRADLAPEVTNTKMIDGVEYAVLSVENISNLIPTEGLNYMLGTALTGVTQSSTWYISLFEGNYTPVAGVTAATYPAAATECTAYDEAARVAWTAGSISAGSVSNTASKAVFTMNATKAVYGIAQTSVSTKSATTGTLISVARFSAVKNVVATDVLNVTSTLSATSA